MTDSSDVVLIFPPLWYYLHIPTELVTIAGYLRSKNINVKSMDLNIDSVDYFLSNNYLKRIADHLYHEWLELNNEYELTTTARARLITLAQELPVAQLLIDSVENAKQLFRDSKRFYDLKQHKLAVRTLNRCWRLISLAHSPTTIDLHKFKTSYDELTLRDCLKAAHDVTQNPYITYRTVPVLPTVLDNQPECNVPDLRASRSDDTSHHARNYTS